LVRSQIAGARPTTGAGERRFGPGVQCVYNPEPSVKTMALSDRVSFDVNLMTRTFTCCAWLTFVLACTEDEPIADPFAEPADWLPPLDTQGERVWFGTDLVDEVCAGTLASLERHVVSIESELGLEEIEEPIWFWLLDDNSFAGLCSSSAAACALSGRVYSGGFGWDSRRHELVHARVRSQGINTHPLFSEGIAAALDQDGGCLAFDDCAELDLDFLLQAPASRSLGIAGYTAGADLVHGMLSAQGPEAVLAFMAEVNNSTGPDEIRATYAHHFNRNLDEDFVAYRRGPLDDFTIGQMGCVLPEAPSAGPAGGVKINAAMDCESSLVVNEFSQAYYGISDYGVMKWSFMVEAQQAGAFELSQSLSTKTQLLSVRRCTPPGFENEQLADDGPWAPGGSLETEGSTIFLGPGLHRILWQAEFGGEFELELSPPCIFEQSNCPDADQCTIWNECEPEVLDPAALGEPCTQAPDGPRACDTGARCLGEVCVAECDLEQPCAGQLTCSRVRVCGPSCDLLAQDCEPGFSCLPASDDASTALGRGACVAAGTDALLSNCDRRDNSCEAGTSCEWVADAKSDIACMAGSFGGADGCCVPPCDPEADDPQCPAELPRCDPIADGPVGVCRAVED
jgi:hypothetical protein